MYYLRKVEIDSDRAIYKATDVPRFYRQHFRGVDAKIPCMKLYTCKTMKKSLS